MVVFKKYRIFIIAGLSIIVLLVTLSKLTSFHLKKNVLEDLTYNTSDKAKFSYTKEYVSGTGNIKGDVDKAFFKNVSDKFDIGANQYGYAVFKDPDSAYREFTRLYKPELDLIRKKNGIKNPIRPNEFSAYMNLAWQTEASSKEEEKRLYFVSAFLDIYENSFGNNE